MLAQRLDTLAARTLPANAMEQVGDHTVPAYRH